MREKTKPTKLQSSYTDEVSGKGVPDWKVQSISSHLSFNPQEKTQSEAELWCRMLLWCLVREQMLFMILIYLYYILCGRF